MSYRTVLPPLRAFSGILSEVETRLAALERRTWPSASGTQWEEADATQITIGQLLETTDPSYPDLIDTVTLTLDPGRWVIMFRASLSITGTEGGQVGMISTVSYDGVTETIESVGSDATVAIGRGKSFTLANVIEVSAVGTITATLPVYYGYYPIDPGEPLPYAFAYFNGATIVGFPG